MKKTGIVRRIDELGRLVIPKEIRKSLRLKEGESLEIFIDKEESIVLKKYSSISSISDFAQKFTDSVNNILPSTILITDMDTVIAASGEEKKDYFNHRISEKLFYAIQKRKDFLEEHFELLEGKIESRMTYMSPIVVNGDCIGSILLLSDQISKIESEIVQIAATFFEKYLEE